MKTRGDSNWASHSIPAIIHSLKTNTLWNHTKAGQSQSNMYRFVMWFSFSHGKKPLWSSLKHLQHTIRPETYLWTCAAWKHCPWAELALSVHLLWQQQCSGEEPAHLPCLKHLLKRGFRSPCTMPTLHFTTYCCPVGRACWGLVLPLSLPGSLSPLSSGKKGDERDAHP